MSYERTEEHRRKHSNYKSAWWKVPGNKESMRGKIGFLPGHKHSEGAKKKISRANKGKKRSLETCERIRRANLERMKDPIQRERLAEIGRSITPEQRERQKAKIRAPKNREKMRQNMLRRKFLQRDTDIEVILQREFRKLRLSFETHKSMFGRWICDIVFEEFCLIVEADGEYWHSKPGRKESDQKLIDHAEKEGWTVFRFSGNRIKKNTGDCVREVVDFIESQKGDS